MMGVCSLEGKPGEALRIASCRHTMHRFLLSTLTLALVITPGTTIRGHIPSKEIRQAAQEQGGPPTSSAGSKADSPSANALPRGKKLVLKDGNFQLVRSYERKGDRVRYLSAERGEWEEIPAALVDWEATAKAEAQEQSEEAALVKAAHKREEAERIEPVLDVDASLEVAKGVFLPPGEGMFALDGKAVTPISQVGTGVKLDKKRLVEQVLSPVPIVPGKQHVIIPGTRAKVRISTSTPEFYLREAPPDPDRASSIQHSSRPGESGPEVELVRATVSGGRRKLATIRSLFGQRMSEDSKMIAIQRWEVAASVYRFTLGEQLPPGEYALAEILPDGMNVFVWDFGVDAPAGPGAKSAKN